MESFSSPPCPSELPDVPDFELHEDFLEWWEDVPVEWRDAYFARCKNDFVFFVHNFVWFEAIPPADVVADEEPTAGYQAIKGWRQLRMWPGQRTALKELQGWFLVVWLKVRQFAATWFGIARAGHSAWFHDDQHIAMISLEREDRAREMDRRLLAIWDKLPPGLVFCKPDMKRWGHNLRAWTNNSQIRTLGTTTYGAASFALTGAVIDEAALIEERSTVDLSEMIDSATVEALQSHRGWLWVISTGRGKAGWFYERCKGLAKKGHLDRTKKISPEGWNDWRLWFSPITDHPRWTERNIEIALSQPGVDERKWRREHPRTFEEAFSTHGLSVFKADATDSYRARIEKGLTPPARVCTFSHADFDTNQCRVTPKFTPYEWDPVDWECKLFVMPKQGHRYCMGIDPAQGIRGLGDYQAMSLRDIDTGEQVLTARAQIDAHDFADICTAVSHFYFSPLIVPETNHDYGILKKLLSNGIGNIIRTTRQWTGHGLVEQVEGEGEKLGFRSTGDGSYSKTRTLEMYKALWAKGPDGWLKINDIRLVEEAETFIEYVGESKTIKPKVKVGAAKGSYDDVADADRMAVIGCKMFPEQLPEKKPAKLGVQGALETKHLSFGDYKASDHERDGEEDPLYAAPVSSAWDVWGEEL